MRGEIRDSVGSHWGGRRPKKCETQCESQKRKKKKKRRWLIWNFVGLAVVSVRCSESVPGVRSSGQDTRTETEVHFSTLGRLEWDGNRAEAVKSQGSSLVRRGADEPQTYTGED